MQKRKLEELNLLDDFLFGSMVSYPGIGERFIKLLLKTILGKDLGKLTVIPQKFYYGSYQSPSTQSTILSCQD